MLRLCKPVPLFPLLTRGDPSHGDDDLLGISQAGPIFPGDIALRKTIAQLSVLNSLQDDPGGV
jgi:hypothetical protein